MRVVGETALESKPYGLDLAPGIANYYKGTESYEGVHSFHSVVYPEVNDSVEMRLLHGQFGPKLAFIFRPGSNPANLQLGFEGQDSLKVDVFGSLRMYVRGRWIAMREAIAYQMNGNAIVPVAWIPEYITSEGQSVVHFHFDTYNETLPLILLIGTPPAPAAPVNADPRNMNWSTYAGGNEGDELVAVDSDANGDVYTCGYTADNFFPVGTGYQEYPAFQGAILGLHESVVMKFGHEDKRIKWATYIGGTLGTTFFNDIGVDEAFDLAVYKGSDTTLNYVFFTGSTGCTDFPIMASVNSPFAFATHEPWTSQEMIHAAYLGAFSQERGIYRWGTILGAGENGYWSADGLGVDVDLDGRVAWVGQLYQVPDNANFDFVPVTPTGAFTKAYGGGFFALFNAQYQYEWKTPFGSQCYQCAAYDVMLRKVGNVRKAYITGVAASGTGPNIYTLDTYAPPGFTGFFQENFGGDISDSYFAELNLNTYQNAFCTRWGGNGRDLATSIAFFGKTVLVAGATSSSNLTGAQLPGSGGMHDNTLNGTSDGFLLKFDLEGGVPSMEYGTLVGGSGQEYIHDIELTTTCAAQNDCDFYLVGETTSTAELLTPEDPMLYHQAVLGNDGADEWRDGWFMGVHSLSNSVFWSSYIGGGGTDKCWGAAATPTELYIVGGTRSNQDHFPLKEYDTNSPLDWYDGDIYNNIGGGLGWYANSSEYFNGFTIDNSFEFDAPGYTHDGFITSFDDPQFVSVQEAPLPAGTLHLVSLDAPGQWLVADLTNGELSVTDAVGREVRRTPVQGGRVLIDLRNSASGVYLVRFTGRDGQIATTKLQHH